MTQAPQSYLDWQVARFAALKAADGWLNIIARETLSEGTVSVGSAPENDIILSAGPAHVGTLTQDADGKVVFTPHAGGAPVALEIGSYPPPRFTAENLLLEVTTLNGENALRVRDTASTAADALKPIDYFPYDASWRVIADWVALEAPKEVTIDTSKSIATDVTATHKAVFTRDGVTYHLLATHGTAQSPQFVIRDLTSRDSTYQAARFVFGEDVTADTIVLDFNKAINPPCAFTDYAICPLPPADNVLDMRIEAGEKRLHQ